MNLKGFCLPMRRAALLAALAMGAGAGNLLAQEVDSTGSELFKKAATDYRDKTVPKIIGGRQAAPRQFPWQVSIGNADVPDAYYAHFCGGSVYSAHWIVTAAHCVWNTRPTRLAITAGTTLLQPGTTRRTGARTLIHPRFNPRTLDNDIALVQLDQPLLLGADIVSIPLLSAGDEQSALTDSLTILGWGAIQQGGSSVRDLRFARVMFVRPDVCGSAGAYPGRITDNMLCAGDRLGADSCQGDSGGPMTVGMRPRLAGIVSWGEGCGVPDKVGVYTRVSRYVPGISACVRAPSATCLATAATPLPGPVAGETSVAAPTEFDRVKHFGMPQRLNDIDDVVLDATTGNFEKFKRVYPSAKPLRFVLRDVNPFLFQYQIVVNKETVQEASTVAFAKFLFGIDLTGGGNLSGQRLGAVSIAAADPKPCPAEGAAEAARLIAVYDGAKGLKAVSADLAGRFNNLETQLRANADLYRGQVDIMRTAYERAPVVATAALLAEKELRTIASLAADQVIAIRLPLRDFVRDAAKFRADVAQGAEDHADCGQFKPLAAVAASVAQDLALFEAAFAAIQKTVTSAEAAGRVIRPIATDPQRFYIAFVIPPQNHPTMVTVKVTRGMAIPTELESLRSDALALTTGGRAGGAAGEGATPQGNQANDTQPGTSGKSQANTQAGAARSAVEQEIVIDTIARHVISMGDRGRFMISFGVGWSGIPKRTYVLDTEVVLLGGGSADTVRRIRYSENSRGQTTPVLMLSSRVWDFAHNNSYVDGLHVLLGGNISSPAAAPSSYFAGGALSILGSRLFLSGGYAVGKVTELTNGQFVGHQLPRGLTAASTTDRLVFQPAAALTVRVFPW